jgi:hypothetical protein
VFVIGGKIANWLFWMQITLVDCRIEGLGLDHLTSFDHRYLMEVMAALHHIHTLVAFILCTPNISEGRQRLAGSI